MSLLPSQFSDLLRDWRDESMDAWPPLPEEDELASLAACLFDEEDGGQSSYEPPSQAASASHVCFQAASPSSCEETSSLPGGFPGPCSLVQARSAGPPTRSKRARLVTTECAEAKPRVQEHPTVPLYPSDDEEDSEDSNDTDEGTAMAGSKRRAPEIDWRSITDPAERRRQRRLAKNRLTAAKSRERKKAAWSQLEGRLSGMEQDNKQLKAMIEALSRENSALRGQLSTRAGGLSSKDQAGPMNGMNTQGGSRTGQESAVLCISIAIMLCLCLSLPGLDPSSSLQSSLQPLLGSAAAPLVLALLAQLLHSTRGSRRSSGPRGALLKTLLGLKALLMSSAGALTKGVKRWSEEDNQYYRWQDCKSMSLPRGSLSDGRGFLARVKLECSG